MIPFVPRVSILTPSFNQAHFLAENLASVRLQGDVEHIVVDGGSQDGSRELLEKSPVRWVSERDGGQADALNKALKMASGEILGWLNSDDLYLPGAVAQATALLDADPGLDMVYGHSDQIDAEGRRFGRVDAYPVDLEQLLSYATIPQPSAFVRRCDDWNVVPAGRLTVIWSRVTRWNSVARDPAGRLPMRVPGVVAVSSAAGTFHDFVYWPSGQSSPSHGISHQ